VGENAPREGDTVFHRGRQIKLLDGVNPKKLIYMGIIVGMMNIDQDLMMWIGALIGGGCVLIGYLVL